MVKQEHEKIMFAAVALIMVVTAFFGGIAYGKTQVVCPDDQVDIVITSSNATGDLIHTEIKPLNPRTMIEFPAVDGAITYQITMGH
jgi:hypothetical protein